MCAKVKDEKRDCSMGTISYPLSKLMQEDQMTITERFLLKNSGPGATLKMKMALRVKHTNIHAIHVKTLVCIYARLHPQRPSKFII